MAPVFSKPIDIAPIEGYEELYWATSQGDVWSVRRRRFLSRDSVNSKGYNIVFLYKGGARKPMHVHRIVAKLFVTNEDRATRNEVDHINNNRRDNRASNLRWVSRSENSHNTSSHKGSTSRYLGVSWVNARNKWQAQIYLNGTNKFLGRFTCEHEAARAYNVAALKYHGPYANLNVIPYESQE
jgi:hypothetical protein